MNLFQILIVTFILISIFKVIKDWKNGKNKIAQLIIWLAIWLLALIVILEPSFTTYLSNYFGVGRGADFIIYIAIIGIYYFSYLSYINYIKLEKKISKLVSEIAILKHELKNIKKSDNETNK